MQSKNKFFRPFFKNSKKRLYVCGRNFSGRVFSLRAPATGNWTPGFLNSDALRQKKQAKKKNWFERIARKPQSGGDYR